MKTKTSPITNSMNRPLWRRGFVLIAFLLTGFALSPQARATCQQGCLTNQNTVLGDDALLNNTGGSNTAIGFNALTDNTTGSNNTAIGFDVLHSNTTGGQNTATGAFALNTNSTGSGNTATGYIALWSNSTGTDNTANGEAALFRNTTGFENTAIGLDALYNTTPGSNNIAVGFFAGGSLTTGNNNIDIGGGGFAGESNTIRIGRTGAQTKTFIAGISGATVMGTAVVVNGSGQLGVAPSSQRFKQKIQAMSDASDMLLALRPVTFEYKPEVDPKGLCQFGLVAEEVEKVNPDLVARDDQGKPYSVRYEAVNAMLLNEFLKEHRKVEEQGAMIAQQQKQIEALTATVQKVTDQIAFSKPAPQLVASP
jgi:trimeric autotransporter adhesin